MRSYVWALQKTIRLIKRVVFVFSGKRKAAEGKKEKQPR